jgi:hypothetical protein
MINNPPTSQIWKKKKEKRKTANTEKYDFYLYKGIFHEKNDPNMPDFEDFLFFKLPDLAKLFSGWMGHLGKKRKKKNLGKFLFFLV